MTTTSEPITKTTARVRQMRDDVRAMGYTQDELDALLATVDEIFPENPGNTKICGACGWPKNRRAGDCKSGEHVDQQRQWRRSA